MSSGAGKAWGTTGSVAEVAVADAAAAATAAETVDASAKQKQKQKQNGYISMHHASTQGSKRLTFCVNVVAVANAAVGGG